MSNLADLAEAVANFVAVGGCDGSGSASAQQSHHAGEHRGCISTIPFFAIIFPYWFLFLLINILYCHY
ncbi:hypothetical protein A2U01_0024581 [Trifolium medium]|uniref:Uncharacterized protein n=1 Tax=Trifolium medium TaxID=97028 RepID=A0A392NUN8_9FABA|nr:hypothetical protein [Trifolium medium]